jgi:hypothetical protein
MSILMNEFHELLTMFFNSVHCGKKTEDEVAIHFAHNYPLIIAPDGSYFDMHTHRQLHKRFSYEHHTIGEFKLIQLSEHPERARAKGWVYFEAKYNNQKNDGLLKSIVGEEYIVERGEDNRIKFVQYNSTFFAPLPDSIPFDINITHS